MATAAKTGAKACSRPLPSLAMVVDGEVRGKNVRGGDPSVTGRILAMKSDKNPEIKKGRGKKEKSTRKKQGGTA